MRLLILVFAVAAGAQGAENGAEHKAQKKASEVAAKKPATVQHTKDIALNKDRNKDNKDDNKDIAQWIAKLNAKTFGDRQEATAKLFRSGIDAFPQLVEAAKTSQIRETVTRCVEIIKRHWKEGTPDAKSKAETALQELEKSSNLLAANRAKSILRPPRVAAPRRFGGNRVLGGGLARPRIRVMRVQRLQIPVAQGNFNRSVKIIAGKKKISINEKPGEIKIEVSDVDKDGKPVIKKWKAKSAADLKQNDPEGYKIYQQYAAPKLPKAVIPNRFGRPAPQPHRIVPRNVQPQQVPKLVPCKPFLPGQPAVPGRRAVPAKPVLPAKPAKAIKVEAT